MSVDFTVAIRTYNGAERLPEVLDQLQQQVGTQEISWEVLVVDNNSRDQTAEIVSRYAQQWRQDCPFRYVFEPQQGATYARVRAVQAANSQDLIGFLDDDNIPADNWVAEAYRFGRDRPQVGAYGGIIHAKLDQPPPPYFDQVKLFLAIYDRGPTAFQYERHAKPRRIPAGPGCVIRKQAWQDCVPQQLALQGQVDETTKVMQGPSEDLEIMYYIQNSNWEVWHNPNMEIWHHIPPKRLEREYLLRVSRASGMSTYALRMARLDAWQRSLMPVLTPLYALSDGYKALTYYVQHRHQFAEDVAKACEFESKMGRLLSPFL